MLVFKTLHILSMVTAVTTLVGMEMFIGLAIWRRDVRGLASIFRMTRGSNPTTVGLVALIAGIVFGLLTAATAGFDLLAGWLVLAYTLVAAMVLLNVSPLKQRIRRLAEQAVEADRGERASEDVVRHMESFPVALFVGTNIALFAAVIVDMVLKPI
jgi:uncharacterized membrane protein